ncbi:hypothetical protein GF322_04955 [Candidatus Dependentiae bacterium]|nr:hypothetical protein [Candidatus Dependentiae bacterium]
MLRNNLFLLYACKYFFFFNFVFPQNTDFSCTYSKFFKLGDFVGDNISNKKTCIWQVHAKKPFDEIIVSWNSFRPRKGQYSFWISLHHNYWSNWYKIAEWGVKNQQTFVNTRNPCVHLKHVRMILNRGKKANSFRIKVVAEKGADLKNLKALFACVSNMNKFKIDKGNITLPAICLKGIVPQSQMNLKHPRFRDLCSPTSLSMMINYFSNNSINLESYIPEFAQLVLDQCYLDIYGNWILNVAQAFDSLKGKKYFRVERLNNFNHLYSFLKKKIPVAVSVRGFLNGGAKSYENGHFILVVGWSLRKQRVLCIDPAFQDNSNTLRAYRIVDFLQAWGTSRNLSYIVF